MMNLKVFFFVFFLVAVSGSVHALWLSDWVRNQSSGGGGGTVTDVIGGDNILNIWNTSYVRVDADEAIDTSLIEFGWNHCNPGDYYPETGCASALVPEIPFLTIEHGYTSTYDQTGAICWLNGDCLNSSWNFTSNTIGIQDIFDIVSLAITQNVTEANTSMKAYVDSNFITANHWKSYIPMGDLNTGIKASTGNGTMVYNRQSGTTCTSNSMCTVLSYDGYVYRTDGLSYTCSVSGYAQTGTLSVGLDIAGSIDMFANTSITGNGVYKFQYAGVGGWLKINVGNVISVPAMRDSGAFAVDTCIYTILIKDM